MAKAGQHGFYSSRKLEIVQEEIAIELFHKYSDDYLSRPPYQRKNVWKPVKQQELLVSLFCQYYIPRLVFRKVIHERGEILEIIDGQQRVNTVRLFFDNRLPLPKDKELGEIAGLYWRDLPSSVKKFVDQNLKFQVDVVLGLEDPTNDEQLQVAAEVFRRLQEGESLRPMEKEHAKLSSLSRNWIVKYGEDYSFDHENYEEIPENRSKLRFFRIYDKSNDRMDHIALLARLLLIEQAGGPTDTRRGQVAKLMDDHIEVDGGIGDYDSFEENDAARAVKRNLNEFFRIFQNDPMYDGSSGIKELKDEYFVIPIYLLLRHLKKHYVLQDEQKQLFREFVIGFYRDLQGPHRPGSVQEEFRQNRRQEQAEYESRDRIVRLEFFRVAEDKGIPIIAKSGRRAFSEREKILIYRNNNGTCCSCDKVVSWSEFEADHVLPHSKGGATEIENGQVLCGECNRKKSNSNES